MKSCKISKVSSARISSAKINSLQRMNKIFATEIAQWAEEYQPIPNYVYMWYKFLLQREFLRVSRVKTHFFPCGA